MELVVALAKRGLESIDVIGMEEYPFEAVLGKEVGKGLMKVCRFSSCTLAHPEAIMIVSRIPRCQVPYV